MNNFQKYLDEQLGNVVFNEEVLEDEEDFPVEQILAQQIVLARKEKNISQSTLSKIIGIQQASLSKIENGEGNPSIQTLQRIAKGLDKKLIITLE